MPLLDFAAIAGEGTVDYFAAVQAGLDKNYNPMKKLFGEVIDRSLSAS